MIAFTHIEKAAGTTLIHILRVNFFMKYCDVKPLSIKSSGILRADDLRKIMMINPLLKCIAGHAIRPFADLCDVAPGIKYITILRDPTRRYISHYQYWSEKLGHKITFEEFLKFRNTHNLQTRKIAGSENVQFAKEILKKRFFLVGIVEEFDEFLVLLKNKLKPINFSPEYRLQNIGKRNSIIRADLEKNIHNYLYEIMYANKLDNELYSYVKNEIIFKEKEKYGYNFEDDLKRFKNENKNYSKKYFLYIDFLLRKCYYEPVIGFIRKMNGLPAKGSY